MNSVVQQNAFENVVWKMLAILFKSQFGHEIQR